MQHSQSHTHIQKARILLDQGRYRDAESELGKALAADPHSDEALSLLARAKIDTDQNLEGLRLIQEALAIDPENDYYLYLKAFAHFKRDALGEAIQALENALSINAYSPAYYALYAYILISKRQFAGALEKANEGLAVDAEDVGCLNARSRALNRLNRVDEAIDTMQDSLAADPDNDFTHVTVGWNYLEKGQHRQASHHFREALRINPANATARDGLKEALKSRIPPYRWFLQYGVWLSGKGRGARVGMTIGLYVCFRLALVVGQKLNPPWSYILALVAVLYLAFVVLSWIIEPVANFFLLFHREGKYALTDNEKYGSIATVSALAAGTAFALFYFFMPAHALAGTFVMAALAAGSLSFVVSKIEFPLHRCFSTRQSTVAAVLAMLGLTALATIFTSPAIGVAFFVIYIILLVLSTWISALFRK
jgi:tetratricopeptide (TPR) repeat protein